MVANPIKMSETPIEYKDAPPLLGQHTDEILKGLVGLDEAGIHLLRQRKIV